MVGLPRAAQRASVDLIHAPAYTAPWWSRRPVVVTIHDVVYELHPEWYPYRRDPLRRAFYRRSALSAAHILTVSHFSATEITAAYGIPPERITVAPLGVDAHFGVSRTPEAPVSSPRPYVLHVGDLHVRRNLALLVDAVIAARRAGGPTRDLVLVLVGADLGTSATLKTRAVAAGSPDLLVHHESIGESALVDLYRGALALVYPSLYEGFGLPLIEAMAAGTPVLGSNAASIPEVTGHAARLLDPSDVDAWTGAIVTLASDAAQRESMRRAGLARAAQFTWDRTARLTLEAYRRAA
jgi:glycosyltransferase involved in cell wall biosynthesis